MDKRLVAIAPSLATFLALICLQPRVVGQGSPKTVWERVYTEDQARRGEAVYREKCTGCHRDSLRGNFEAPPLRGLEFAVHWRDLSMAKLLAMLQEQMPASAPGSLARKDYVDVIT